MEEIDKGLVAVKIKWRSNLKTNILPRKCGENGLYASTQPLMERFDNALGKVGNSQKIINFVNMTDSDLKIITEKFIYLNTCPGIFKPWILFYMDLFQNQSPQKIILILNRILKRPHENYNFKWKKIAKQLFEKVTTIFPLNYKDIHNQNQDGGFLKGKKCQAKVWNNLKLHYRKST